MQRFAIYIAVLGVILAVSVENTSAGRTIKKHSAIPKKPVVEVETEDGVVKPQVEAHVVPEKEVKTSELEGCSEDSGQCKKKPSSKTKNYPVVTSAAVSAHPTYQHRPALPQTMYDLYWRNRLRNSSPVQMSSQKLLPKLQRASLEMAKGILSGLGWDTEGWEMVLLESIVKTVTKDLLFMFQMFF